MVRKFYDLISLKRFNLKNKYHLLKHGKTDDHVLNFGSRCEPKN